METYRIEFLRTALKELASLPQNVQERIKANIDALQTDPRPPGVKALKNGNGGCVAKILPNTSNSVVARIFQHYI